MNLLRFIKRSVPVPLKQKIKDVLRNGGHPGVRFVKDVSRVQDLYYWAVDDEVDTVVPLHNYFSVLFPDLETSTSARIEILAADGRVLGGFDVPVPTMTTPTILLSEARRRLGFDAVSYGSVVWDLATPPAVLDRLSALREPFLLWDRSYIGYIGPAGQSAFVHGIDKTYVVDTRGRRRPWPMGKYDSFVTAPEIPLMAAETKRTDIVVLNRSASQRTISLAVHDQAGGTREWQAAVPPSGAHRFMLDAVAVDGLFADAPLAITVRGLPTRYGRPLVFKRFGSGAISAMHC